MKTFNTGVITILSMLSTWLLYCYSRQRADRKCSVILYRTPLSRRPLLSLLYNHAYHTDGVFTQRHWSFCELNPISLIHVLHRHTDTHGRTRWRGRAVGAAAGCLDRSASTSCCHRSINKTVLTFFTPNSPSITLFRISSTFFMVAAILPCSLLSPAHISASIFIG